MQQLLQALWLSLHLDSQPLYRAYCSVCHRSGEQSGAIGPNLTAVATRFKRQDILESATEPSKVLSEQYADTAFVTTSGRVIVGRITEETEDKVVVRPNPLEAATVTIKKSEIDERQLSSLPCRRGCSIRSPKTILHLLAYLESLG